MNDEEKAMKLKKFLDEYQMMRKYQKLYFKNRMQSDLQRAKQYEAVCDKLFLEITDAQGKLL